MLSNFRYLVVLARLALLFPWVWLAGKKLLKEVPRLPPAEQPSGVAKSSTQHTEVRSTSSKKKILFVGESTIAGVGVATHADGFAGHFAQNYADTFEGEFAWEVVAHGGYTIQKVRERLVLPMHGHDKEEISHIVLGIGGNDIFEFAPPWRIKKETILLLDALNEKYPDKPILIAALPAIRIFPAFPWVISSLMSELCEIYRDELRDLASTRPNLIFDDSRLEDSGWESLNRPVSDFFSDGVHPSGLTYSLWAAHSVEVLCNHRSHHHRVT